MHVEKRFLLEEKVFETDPDMSGENLVGYVSEGLKDRVAELRERHKKDWDAMNAKVMVFANRDGEEDYEKAYKDKMELAKSNHVRFSHLLNDLERSVAALDKAVDKLTADSESDTE